MKPIEREAKALREHLADVVEKIRQHQQRRVELQAARASKDDIKAAVARWVDDMAALFPADLRSMLNEFIVRPHAMQGPLRLNQALTFSAETTSRFDRGPRPIDRALCALFGPAIKSALLREIDLMPQWEGAGLPAAERAAEIARIDALLEELCSEEARLTEQAAAAGISLVDGFYIRH